ncbi:hypothetical protein [Ramlibacter sp.]|uniref:hypothetical protein n=1 Tax=Ramlibacter sp. TaxID=1917967 RepID=UPI003D0D2727
MNTLAAHARRPAPARGMNVLFALSLWVFLLSCVFDPADKVFGLKVWAFAACWGIGTLRLVAGNEPVRVRESLLAYTLLFILIPILSIFVYYVRGGGEPFDGFQMLKGYVLISFALLLDITRTDLFERMAATLTLLAVAIIGTAIAIAIFPDLEPLLYVIGADTGILSIDNRDYGADVVLFQVYFVTSPMLAIAIAHYYDRARSAQTRGARIRFAALVAVNVVGMVLAGTRNNILVGIALPLSLWFLHSNRKALATVVAAAAFVLAAYIFRNELGAFFDPEEHSNSAKLNLLNDYAEIFSSLPDLIFGQGLGAFYPWSPPKAYASVAELTYLEMIRNFGIFGALGMLALLLHPIFGAFGRNRPARHATLAVGYGYYMLMCATNPNMFSSMGILILSVMLASHYREAPAPASATRPSAGQPT